MTIMNYRLSDLNTTYIERITAADIKEKIYKRLLKEKPNINKSNKLSTILKETSFTLKIKHLKKDSKHIHRLEDKRFKGLSNREKKKILLASKIKEQAQEQAQEQEENVESIQQLIESIEKNIDVNQTLYYIREIQEYQERNMYYIRQNIEMLFNNYVLEKIKEDQEMLNKWEIILIEVIDKIHAAYECIYLQSRKDPYINQYLEYESNEGTTHFSSPKENNQLKETIKETIKSVKKIMK